MPSKGEVQSSELLSSGIDRISRDEGRRMVERRMYKTAAVLQLTDDEYHVINSETGRAEAPQRGRPNEPYMIVERGKWNNEINVAEQTRALARWEKLVAQRRAANNWLNDHGLTGEIVDKVELERHLDQCFPIKGHQPHAVAPADSQTGEHISKADDDRGTEQQTGVVGRQRLPERPLNVNGRPTSKTAAWDTIGEHDLWSKNGVPPHWSHEMAGKEVARYFKWLVKAGKLQPSNYDHLRQDAAGDYTISPDSVERALEART
jgi:hypothetical protein